MNCTLCGSSGEIEKGTSICRSCISSFEKNQVPAIDFKEFFSRSLENKLNEVDSLLFTLPENFFLWYLKGHLEHELGESKKALRSINTSISYKEDFGDSWIRMGLIYSDMHREGDAIENFEKGLKYPLLDPSNLVDAGSSLIAAEQPGLAINILQRSLELLPHDDRAMVGLAKAYVGSGKMDHARSLMEKAIELYPHNEEVLRSMAQIMMRMGDLEVTMDMYSRILDQHPSDFEALLAKGEIYLRTGQLTRSMKSYKAVRELDIHISWEGILKYIVSNLSELIEKNQNQPSYREDLRKEYENLRLFLKELYQKVHSRQGPELLDQIENLIKVIENIRISLKESILHFEDLLSTYKVEDSFHRHLSSKVADLKEYHRESRYYDAKQITLELTPFLSDLRSMDTRTESKLKDDIGKRMKEMEEVGISTKSIKEKLVEVGVQENEGNLEGATFLLKEIQISIDELWKVQGKSYFNNKLKEIEDLLEKGKEKFDTSRLEKKYENFKEQFQKGPRSVLESYLDFTRTYSEDSEKYYKIEVERTLKEIDYKIVILDKDGKDTKPFKQRERDLRRRFDEGEKPLLVYQEVEDLLKDVSEMEMRSKAAEIRQKLMDLDELLGDVDALGMDTEIAKNVEPVRRVIERSLNNENYRLADILTEEVYENVEKLLMENYLDDLRASMEESINETERLEKLGVKDPAWSSILEMARKRLEAEEPKGPFVPLVSKLAELQMMIQDFYVERLSTEIDRRIGSLSKLHEEGIGFGFNLEWEKENIDDLCKRSEDISSLEILEEAVSMHKDLEKKVKEMLSQNVQGSIEEIRSGVEEIIKEGATNKQMMDVMDHVNRSEVLLEKRDAREAYKTMILAREEMERTKKRVSDNRIDSYISNIERILRSASESDVKMQDFDKKLEKMSSKGQKEKKLRELKEMQDEVWEIYNSGILSRFDQYETASEDLIRTSNKLLPESEIKGIRNRIKELEMAIRNGDIDSIPVELKKTEEVLRGLENKATEGKYLSQCSGIIDSCLSMDDERAEEMMKKAQGLARSIKDGKTKGIEKEITKLQNEMRQLSSLLHMQNIETMLSDIEDLDDLSKELVSEMEGEDFEKDIKGITGRIKDLLDSTPALYSDPDAEMVSSMADSIEMAREDIIELENKWRASKRIQELEDMGAYQIELGDKLLQKDLLNLKVLYEKGDHIKFFRVYERVTGQMDKIKRQLMILSNEDKDDKAREILVRGKGIKRKDQNERSGPSVKMAGIQRLARDMGEKRKKLDKTPDEKKAHSKGQDKWPLDKGPEGDTIIIKKKEDGSNDKNEKIAGMAKLIAGNRIKKLEEKGSTSVLDVSDEGEEDRSLPWNKKKTLRMEGLDIIMDEIEDLNGREKEESARSNAENIKNKLDKFYGKLPDNLQLEESIGHYDKGVKYLDKSDHTNSIREFRIAISSAVKMTKLHKEITKAINSIDRELSRRRKLGEDDQQLNRIYNKAEEALEQGRLSDCAKLVKVMKKELFDS